MTWKGPDRYLVNGAGAAGMLAALCWSLGDVLICGHVANPADYPLLFTAYADRLTPDFVMRLVGVSTSRLAAGALIAVFSVPLYLVGTWHLWKGIEDTGRAFVVPVVTLLGIGYALSPLPHAAFYFVGATYQSVLATPVDAHPQLLAQATQFQRLLEIVYWPSVGSQLLGMLGFSLAVASGRSHYPRWFAIPSNPLFLGVGLFALTQVLHGWASAWLSAATFNIAWLIVYAMSFMLLRTVPRNSAGGTPK